jgi:Holliday junction DNA helicase RuvA
VIAKLTGVIDRIGEDGVVIDVGGVGYLVFCSAHTARQLPGRGEAARLLVETHVREDHIHLYGFADEAEKSWFRLLTTVQGVGAKLGLAILSTLQPEQLHRAILTQDKAALAQADGVGPKLAMRIVNELRDKAGGIALGPAAMAASAAPVPEGAGTDAISALVNLGYKRPEASSAVAAAARKLGPEARVDALIRAGLQELAR